MVAVARRVLAVIAWAVLIAGATVALEATHHPDLIRWPW
jgi:hypothetical protein